MIHSPVARLSRPLRSAIRLKSTATSALEYKAAHRGSRLPSLSTIDPPSWTVPEAISNILYNTPTPSKEPPKRHVLNCLVQNEPGVLSRVSGILAARGFNIDSLVVCNTEVEDLSRMTIVLCGQDGVIEQARRQLEDLVPVWAVLDYSHTQIVQRELLLAKVSLLGPEHFHELLAHHKDELADEYNEDAPSGEHEPFHPVNLAPSEALRQKHQHLSAITDLAKNFGGKVSDISTNTCIVELSAKPTRIDAFIVLLRPFGLLEAARSGMMALPRTPLDTGIDKEIEMDEAEIVDVSSLPPG
ncbi:putative Mitochondrial acetolactate synthase small subunit [Taphrina deformans PYCC 5710]|uniref:Mitochondrial acetolactate synthase small subunit n=1 Tax=Taphrina deformans (strain PYCC 5710 / ATCC 11124 / CBS 356.35 / IMI 108563 / JCM 9778 / NBRC 8474) TaxID=1097556 RepID=R4X9P4_TAPDE|nr:putative Mitochondrial acetolactate synthase small subunit [Taphrina deformans PYCC 5710]|eukprot:CCG82486.1 putative Mitochondrial acetolactate synthase small subunit [Taphrina deformans PYCC 5710]